MTPGRQVLRLFQSPLFMTNNTYNLTNKENEKFKPVNYPVAMSELSALRSGIAETPIYFKVEIVISYLKNHSLQAAWVDANPALTRMITSGFFKTTHLESLFESGRNNKTFLKDFEEYISNLLLNGKN